jgi:ubiquinone/menaquinone biosynthesis C-methylase UbiE
MPGPRFYNLLYRIGAPWGGGPRPELVRLIEGRTVTAATHPRALDLGCGEGQDSLFLARHGFKVTAVDFSTRAIDTARKRAKGAGVADQTTFVVGDLTAESLPGVEGLFDFLFDGGSIDDIPSKDRAAAARLVTRVARPGAKFLMWCFFARRSELPFISLTGPSRLGPGFEPGEVERLYGAAFAIERIDPPQHRGRWACFLLTRRA